ncbi:hypothetical protein MMC25_006457 [Agyrium rufum]|nr:hypothetical protein [Agyrium rufum]
MSKSEPLEIESSDDEDLKLALAMSLAHGESPIHRPTDTSIVLTSTNEPGKASTPEVKDGSDIKVGGLAGLDRKAMEAERLARKRKRDGKSISPPARKRVESMPVSRPCTYGVSKFDKDRLSGKIMVQRPISGGEAPSVFLSNDLSTPRWANRKGETLSPTTSLQYPRGVVKKTWALGYARDGLDIKIEEVFQRKSLKLAVLSSFQWDIEWLFSKVDIPRTKLILVMQAEDEATKQQYRSETSSMANLRLCFPSMEGQVHCMHSKLMLLAHGTHLRVVVPTANLVAYDWGENGVMENSVFMIDLPRLEGQTKAELDQMTFFAKELMYFCKRKGLPETVIESLTCFDWQETKNYAFIHTIGGAHMGADEPWRRTGYCGLGNAVTQLGLATEQRLHLDFVTSSLGSISRSFLSALYLAAQGKDGTQELDWRVEASARSRGKKTQAPLNKTASQLLESVDERISVFFPSQDTVARSKGGPQCAGPICFSSKWWNAPTFPRKILRDCISIRRGLLMHNKILSVHTEPVQDDSRSQNRVLRWTYVGSANCSESAWGKLVYDAKTKKPKLNCRNWECGVLIPNGSLQLNTISTNGGYPPTNDAISDSGRRIRIDEDERRVPVPMEYPGIEMSDSIKPWFFAEGS